MSASNHIDFFKYQGTGNDFIIIDGREKNPALTTEQIRLLCDRRLGIGADGLMYLLPSANCDFEMKYFNADGNEGSMCGNGGRCLVRFAADKGIHRTQYRFMAIDGFHLAEIDHQGWIRLKMGDVKAVQHDGIDHILHTGSPHFVRMVNEVKNLPVFEEGRAIRNSKPFAAEGINVNFVETLDDHTIFVRTYERGVEDETLSCGTGVTACALVSAHNEKGFNQVDVQTRGGSLSVEFDKIGPEQYENIWLCGPATFVFSGTFPLGEPEPSNP